MKKIVILTGATGGLGKEFLKQILKEEIDQIWAIARNEQRLLELREKYGEKVIPISIDLSDLAEIKKVEYMLKEHTPCVKYLINNAGLAKMGKYDDFSIEEIDQTINVNCKAPVMLSQFCIPYMEEGSKILNISSASAFQPNPYINLYAAKDSENMQKTLEGLSIYVNAVLNKYLLQYQETPDVFFENSDKIKAEMKNYLDLMLFGICKE